MRLCSMKWLISSLFIKDCFLILFRKALFPFSKILVSSLPSTVMESFVCRIQFPSLSPYHFDIILSKKFLNTGFSGFSIMFQIRIGIKIVWIDIERNQSHTVETWRIYNRHIIRRFHILTSDITSCTASKISFSFRYIFFRTDISPSSCKVLTNKKVFPPPVKNPFA